MEQTIESLNTDTSDRQQDGIKERPVVAAVLAPLAVFWGKIRAQAWGIGDKLNSDVTRSLNVERISAHLGVARKAQEDGRRGIPPANEDTFTGTQREIVNYFSALRRRASRQVMDAADKLRDDLDELQSSDSMAKLRDVPSSCEKNVIRYIADVDVQLKKAVEQEQNERLHYDAFRKNHGLDRVAETPRKAYSYFLIMPVLILALAFALANRAGVVLSADIAAPLVWIAAVSVAAVGIPFMLGDSLVRWMNHVSLFRNLLGLISVAFSLLLIAAIARYADFRMAAAVVNTDASHRELLDAILASPLNVALGIADWKSVALVLTSGLLALLLAYQSDDPYPGYGAVQRRYFNARDSRDALFLRVRKRINRMIDESEAEVDGIGQDFKKRVRVIARRVEKSERTPAVLKDFDADLEDACNTVLETYRTANKAVRKVDSPNSFTEYVCFNPQGEMDSTRLVDGMGQVAALQAAVTELEKETERARQKLRDLNLRMISQISDPAELESA